ncbi:hypothetical protein BJ085DRAFT_38610 [Dimargaris cristalligena]|uniref:Prolyl endopeptidase-like n=1 Tax=Dimargaris cristalligena TaxID=215637 RepID=A0A4P9ZV39_9FUNG|nr:hypothetical protein BJ085DRAFT_38610 [Dimargaris cristalligena]|eukprot:RKP37138.1 hypothetical protein BJ085DRAFT_38610 [Dimargaris cristalligena]
MRTTWCLARTQSTTTTTATTTTTTQRSTHAINSLDSASPRAPDLVLRGSIPKPVNQMYVQPSVRLPVTRRLGPDCHFTDRFEYLQRPIEPISLSYRDQESAYTVQNLATFNGSRQFFLNRVWHYHRFDQIRRPLRMHHPVLPQWLYYTERRRPAGSTMVTDKATSTASAKSTPPSSGQEPVNPQDSTPESQGSSIRLYRVWQGGSSSQGSGQSDTLVRVKGKPELLYDSSLHSANQSYFHEIRLCPTNPSLFAVVYKRYKDFRTLVNEHQTMVYKIDEQTSQATMVINVLNTGDVIWNPNGKSVFVIKNAEDETGKKFLYTSTYSPEGTQVVWCPLTDADGRSIHPDFVKKGQPVTFPVNYWDLRIDSNQGQLFIVKNRPDTGEPIIYNGPLAATSDSALQKFAHLAANETITYLRVFKNHLVVFGVREGSSFVRIFDLLLPQSCDIPSVDHPLPEKYVTIHPAVDLAYDSDILQFYCESPLSDIHLVEFDMRTQKTNFIEGPTITGFDRSRYEVAMEYAPAKEDGVKIPMLLVKQANEQYPGPRPTLVHSNGAYGQIMPLVFEPENIMLLQRGWNLAYPFIRGGGECGQKWYEGGVRERKDVAARDLIQCAKHLIAEGHAEPGLMGLNCIKGGGFVGGIAVQKRPHQFRAVTMDTPLVDPYPLTAKLDPMAAAPERVEYGDPPAELADLKRPSQNRNQSWSRSQGQRRGAELPVPSVFQQVLNLTPYYRLQDVNGQGNLRQPPPGAAMASPVSPKLQRTDFRVPPPGLHLKRQRLVEISQTIVPKAIAPLDYQTAMHGRGKRNPANQLIRIPRSLLEPTQETQDTAKWPTMFIHTDYPQNLDFPHHRPVTEYSQVLKWMACLRSSIFLHRSGPIKRTHGEMGLKKTPETITTTTEQVVDPTTVAAGEKSPRVNIANPEKFEAGTQRLYLLAGRLHRTDRVGARFAMPQLNRTSALAMLVNEIEYHASCKSN